MQIWFAAFHSDPETLRALEVTLSQRERDRASRFVFDKHRVRYIFAQGVLRDVLSRATGIPAAEIAFTSNSYGKPFLKAPAGGPSLQFNLSHSDDLVAVGLASHGEIGVDVEFIRHVLDLHGVAQNNYTQGEFESLLDAPEHAQQALFFRYWTRKESYIKAVGKGLSIPLNTFDTRFPPEAKWRAFGRTPDAPHVDSWWMEDLKPPSNYAGAVTIEKGLDRIEYFNWRR